MSLRNKFSVSVVTCRKLLYTENLRQKIWRQHMKPLEKTIFVYVQHHVIIIFANMREGTLRRREITWLFICFVRELTVNILCFMKIQKFLHSGTKRTLFFQIIVTFLFSILKNYVNTKITCNKCSLDYLH